MQDEVDRGRRAARLGESDEGARARHRELFRHGFGDEPDEQAGLDQGDSPRLTPDEARRLRERMAQVSPWRVVLAQAVVGLLSALVAWAVGADKAVAGSLLYGAWAVALPAALFARALARDAGAGFFLWELVKVGLTVALLAAAPRMVSGLNWLALLAGVILATKMYGLAFVFARRPRRRTGN